MTTPNTPTGPTRPTGPTTFTARSPEDLLALVPIVLGFVPHDSVVMLTFGAERVFHARVDLPGSDEEVPEVVEALLEPAQRHRVGRVVFVVYATDGRAARTVGRALTCAFEEADVAVLEVLRADGRRWFAALGERPDVPEEGVPYDVSAHPFAAQSVVDGRVTHGSRQELATSLLGDPARVAGVATALAQVPSPGRRPGAAAARPPTEEMEWARRLVRDHVAAGTTPRDADLARLLVGMRDLHVRDAAWLVMTRENAPDHVDFWTDVVRRTPLAVLAAPAALLGFAAWLSGHGALAWCALDRCRESVPAYRLADLLGGMLAQAVPPSSWEEWEARDDPA